MAKKKTRKYFFISILSLIGFFLIWEALTAWIRIVPNYVMPSPVQVLMTFIRKLSSKTPDGATLFQNLAASLEVAVSGFLAGSILGVPLGMAMAWNKKVDLFARPLFDLLRPIPPLAWIPVMILWLGIGTPAKAAVIFMSAFIPNVINSYMGIKQTNTVHLWVGQVFGATRGELFRKIALPTALPYVFTGLRISLGTSWVSLVAAEMLASVRGLGYMIQIGRLVSRPDVIIVGMLTIGAVGALLAFLLKLVEDHFVRGGNK
jgi:NitT/TauT family transport system permease protein/taurine transport system permease protein